MRAVKTSKHLAQMYLSRVMPPQDWKSSLLNIILMLYLLYEYASVIYLLKYWKILAELFFSSSLCRENLDVCSKMEPFKF